MTFLFVSGNPTHTHCPDSSGGHHLVSGRGVLWKEFPEESWRRGFRTWCCPRCLIIIIVVTTKRYCWCHYSPPLSLYVLRVLVIINKWSMESLWLTDGGVGTLNYHNSVKYFPSSFLLFSLTEIVTQSTSCSTVFIRFLCLLKLRVGF